ncbi:MAG: hypothetical protein IT559_05295 [Alphaproteobacteria bacterium]|nr:hypothetical protein [Alphaproteobacteria bacterium]
MIGVLGTKRVLAIILLLALNVILAMAIHMYLVPRQVQQGKDLRGLQGEISTIEGDISRMKVEFSQIETQKEEYERLEKRGFFKDQNRRDAENVFSHIQKFSGVNVAVANISAGIIEENAEAKKARQRILTSPVKIRMEAVDDIDLFHYLFLLNNYFPGHITVEKVSFKRESDVTGTVLRSIATGTNPPLVTAEVDVLWRTMIPDENLTEKGAP